MPRDFFAFCTGLKPVELRAIGALSWVRHLNEGEQLYAAGEPGNALYIVNRGNLEARAQSGRHSNTKITLARGEIIGDVELFCDIRRTQTVRATNVASLQCFPRNNLPELIKRVPMFFRFLCEQMAGRLVTERELAAEKDDSLELSGSISNFDLTTIYQTIMSSGQTGELALRDENGDNIGVFYFEDGRPAAGEFLHLTGNEAFWQLFLTDNLAGTFSFSAGPRARTASESSAITAKGDLLISALQSRDELDAMKRDFANYRTRLRVRASTLQWSDDQPVYLRPVADEIWSVLLSGPKSIPELCRHCSVCEITIFRAVTEMLNHEQLAYVNPAETALIPKVLANR